MKILKDKTIGKQFLIKRCIKLILIMGFICGVFIFTPVMGNNIVIGTIESTTDDVSESELETTYTIELEGEKEEEETLVDADETFIDSVNESAEKLPVVNTGSIPVKKLNVRSTGNSDNADNIIGLLVYGDNVNIVGNEHGWYKIEYEDSYGYIYSKYVDVDGYKDNKDDDSTMEVIKPNKTGNEVVTNSSTQQSTNVIGYDYIDPDILYNVVADIAPELTSTCEALISNYEQYGLKPSFQLAVFCLESGYGTSYLAKNKNNICGLNAYATSSKSVYENATYFETKSDCVLKFGDIIYNNYVLNGRTSIERISTKYCPPNSQHWTNMVKSIQKNIERTYNSYAV